MTGDRDLLEALFAQQLGLAPASDIMAAGAEWLVQREKGVSLKDVLQARGVLDAPRARLIDALVDEAIAQHGGSAAQTLQSLPPAAQQSLDGLTTTLRSGESPLPPGEGDGTPVSGATAFDSLETPENIGVEAKGRYSLDTGRKGRTVELGRGGAGRVVVARDHYLQRDVALKELHREITQNPKYDTLHVRGLEARFLREARVTGQLEHPAVVPVYELGRRRDGTLYYTMRRVRGRTLAQAFADTSSLEGRLAFVPDLLTACRAVAAAHHRAVIHRDLKPQNVMLGPHGETYVMDWGLARVMGRADRHQSTVQLAPDLTGGRDLGPVGTPSYMSPEQAAGHRDDVDERSDVWGLGAMLFELLTGRAPYVGRSPWEVLAEVRTTPPPPVTSLAPTAPPELVAVCARALAWDRAGRYRDAGELAADLDAWLSGRRVSAYAYSPLDVGRRLLKRHKATAVLGAASAALLLVLASFAAVRVGRERDEARSMARFFLADVAPTLASVPGTGEVLEQLSTSALEAFAATVDLEKGDRDDRLLLARAWNDLAHQNWRLGRRDASRQALAASRRRLEPLLRQLPGDLEVRAAALEAALWALDLRIDECEDVRGALAALADAAARLRELGPPTAQSLSVERVIASRGVVVYGAVVDQRRSLHHARRARALADEQYRLAPDDPGAAAATIDETVPLAALLVTMGQRVEALEALRAAARQAERLRAQRDGRDLKESHAAVLAELARALDPRRDAAEWRAALTEARRLLGEVQRTDPGKNIVLYDLTVLALLDGDDEEAWTWAERIAAMELGAEYDEAVIVAAFATGRDALVREKALEGNSGSPAAAALWAALTEALAGHRALAREHLARCEALRCGEKVVWLPGMLERRLSGRDDAVARTLLELAKAHPVATTDGRLLGDALRRFSSSLEAPP